MRFTMISRLAKAMAREYTIQGSFKLGYRNKEDVSNLPAYTLVVGSQNVLTNSSDIVSVRNGYSLDGSAGNQNTYGIDSNYDFNTRVNGIQNLRKWGTTLECRYKNPVTKAISWISLMTSLSASNICNFTDFWDSVTELKNLCLFVNGGNNVYEWSGGVGSFASATANTITVSGSKTLPHLNFYSNSANQGKMQLLINGTTYKYTSAGSTPSTPFSQNPTNNKIASTPTTWNSQLFTTGAAASQITQVAIIINAAAVSNVSANFTGAIYTDNAGVPGTLIGSVSASLPGAFSAGDFGMQFNFAVGVNPLTNYHFVVYSDQSANISVYTGTSGAVGTNTSTNSGATWAGQNGYLNMTVLENDISSATFVGVTPDPTGAGISVGDAVVQPPVLGVTLANGITYPFSLDLIGTQRNQVYYGSLSDQTVYISKVNIYSDCGYSSPRLPADGAVAVLDATPTAFIAQSDGMYVSAGRDFWYKSVFTLSSDNTKEYFEFNRLKTSVGQGAQSQSYITKMKNQIVYLSYEPIINSLGPVKNILSDPQVMNLSDSIKNDINGYTYNSKAGQAYYANYFVYFSIPDQSIVRIWNVLRKYWEAPQVMPVGRFYEIGDGNLYAHSALTNESYQVFVPGVFNDNGNPINAIAAFPYMSQEGGQAVQKKFFNKFFTEGYMSTNTNLTLGINYDFGGYSGTYSKIISGANPRKVFNRITDGSLGENPLGSQPIGSILNLPETALVPKFRSIDTFVPVNNFEYQVVYSSNDVDQNWSLLRFGPAISAAKDNPIEIMD